jgi:membrane glycosyltransferase
MGGVALALKSPGGAYGFGGPVRLVVSAIGLVAISILIAPILMALHTAFVVNTLRGKRAVWSSQNRQCDEIAWNCAWQLHRWHTFGGALVAFAVYYFAPNMLLWLTPALAGLVLSAPVSVAISSAKLGRAWKQLGLLRVPEEVVTPPIVQRYRQLSIGRPGRVEFRRDRLFKKLLRDPIWLRCHLSALDQMTSARAAPADTVNRVQSRIAANDWPAITSEEKSTILCDPAALTRLHRKVWIQRAR